MLEGIKCQASRFSLRLWEQNGSKTHQTNSAGKWGPVWSWHCSPVRSPPEWEKPACPFPPVVLPGHRQSLSAATCSHHSHAGLRRWGEGPPKMKGQLPQRSQNGSNDKMSIVNFVKFGPHLSFCFLHLITSGKADFFFLLWTCMWLVFLPSIFVIFVCIDMVCVWYPRVGLSLWMFSYILQDLVQ